MFTGIVEEVGVVAKISDNGMTVLATKVTEDLKLGDSIAVNGTCLTAVSFDRTEFSVDLSPETVCRTSLGRLSVGGPVNLERALLASDRMGGHIVQGHVPLISQFAAALLTVHLYAGTELTGRLEPSKQLDHRPGHDHQVTWLIRDHKLCGLNG